VAEASVPPQAMDRIIELLRMARDAPERRGDIGQQAARLWWELDGAGHCGEPTPDVWETALLGLAAWHTGDDRLRLQRASDAEIERYLRTLGSSPPLSGPRGQ
jgi:hypothetical protein